MNCDPTGTCDQIWKMLEPTLTRMGYELVHLEFKREPHGMVLRFYLDREGGITLDDCTMASREIGTLLEVEDPIEGAYFLEVSSPGLNRPLVRLTDYLRFKGHRAHIRTRKPLDGQRRFNGILDGMKDETVLLITECGSVQIPLPSIEKANLEVEL